jgi:hypothetical protein
MRWGKSMQKIIKFSVLLSIIFILSIIFMGTKISDSIIFIFEEPFLTIGLFIRKLSLLSALGNMVALFLYLCFSFIPLWLLIWMIIKKKTINIDYWFLSSITIFLLWMMYYMINPNLLTEMLPPILSNQIIDGNITVLRIYRVGFVFTLDVLIITYLFVRFYVYQKTSIYKLINVIVYIVVFSVIFRTFYIQFSILINRESTNSFNNLQNIMNFTLQLVSTIIIVSLINLFQQLIRYLELNEVNDQLLDLSKRVSKYAIVSVVVILSSLLINNLYHLLLAKQLEDIQFILTIPMLDLVVVMVMLLITEYIRRTYLIHEENSLTI